MTDNMAMPTPVAHVWSHLQAIQDAYIKAKAPETRPDEALDVALRQSLSSTEYDDVRRYSAGEMDATYTGSASGREFHRMLIDQMEGARSDLQAGRERIERFQTMDVVDLAQELATDQQWAAHFRTLELRGDEDGILRLLDAVVDALSIPILKPRTKTGRQSKLEQARKTIEILGTKASNAPGKPAENQVLWCRAILEYISELEV